jgi:hypothetical protein
VFQILDIKIKETTRLVDCAMFRAALLVACLASASAFAPSALLPRAGARGMFRFFGKYLKSFAMTHLNRFCFHSFHRAWSEDAAVP